MFRHSPLRFPEVSRCAHASSAVDEGAALFLAQQQAAPNVNNSPSSTDVALLVSAKSLKSCASFSYAGPPELLTLLPP
jgi:hypothetical protein